MTDPLTLVADIAAGAAIVFAGLTYLEARRQRQLSEVMVGSLAFIERTSKRRAPPAPRPQRNTQPKASPTSLSSSRDLQELELARRREERKQLELQLRQQREQWKRQKDVAKAIGWVLDRLGTDEEEEED